MYAKCGSFSNAKELFYSMANKTIVTWTIMITACALSGDVKDALDLFLVMVQMGMKPNHITFLAVLQACAHGGLLERGLECFSMMTQKYGIRPGIDHYSCMVDLLGRKGQLREALEIIECMPFEPDAGIWSALLSACKLHAKMEMAKYVSERLFQLEPRVAVPYVKLANIYASAGMWDGVAAIRRKMKYLQVRKCPGQSIIQVSGNTHIFTVEYRHHPEALYIYDILDGLTSHSRQAQLTNSEMIGPRHCVAKLSHVQFTWQEVVFNFQSKQCTSCANTNQTTVRANCSPGHPLLPNPNGISWKSEVSPSNISLSSLRSFWPEFLRLSPNSRVS
ncbi:Pentatricopeptide repeat-containing protein [Arachis hypogaea]|nr:Pentatricopeptide repeat-containing protein [Arachis hypogaea]